MPHADERDSADGRRYPLRGTPVVYPDPTPPVAEADWHALQADPLVVPYPHVHVLQDPHVPEVRRRSCSDRITSTLPMPFNGDC
jgi:hypothetical protein